MHIVSNVGFEKRHQAHTLIKILSILFITYLLIGIIYYVQYIINL